MGEFAYKVGDTFVADGFLTKRYISGESVSRGNRRLVPSLTWKIVSSKKIILYYYKHNIYEVETVFRGNKYIGYSTYAGSGVLEHLIKESIEGKNTISAYTNLYNDYRLEDTTIQ